MTSDECNDNGGTSDGNCAAGFGVCCMFTSTCATGSLTNTISRVSKANNILKLFCIKYMLFVRMCYVKFAICDG